MPSYSHSIDIAAPPAEVFALLDDVERTPEWLGPCTRMAKVSDGPNAVGTRLDYEFKQGRGTGRMDGEIIARRPDDQLAMRFSDRMMQVTVDFRPRPGEQPGTTRLTHIIEIDPRGVARLLSPLISRGLPKQTRDAMAAIKRLAEDPADKR